MARLEILNGKSAGTIFELLPEEEEEDGEASWEVGTARRAQLRIRDRGISYSHATVLCEDGVFQLVDEQSQAGTFVNGERLVEHSPRTLADGDTLRFGTTQAVFTCEPASPERSPSSRLEALRDGAANLERADHDRELSALRAELEATRNAAEKLRAELAETEAELADAITEVRKARAATRAAESERDALAEELDATQQTLAEAEAAPPADAEAEGAQAAQAEAEARAADLEEQVQRLRANLEQALEAAPEETADLAAQELEEAQRKIDELEAELEEQRLETQNLHVELDARNLRIQELAEARQDLVEETKNWNSDDRRDAETRPVNPEHVARLRRDVEAEAEDLRQQVEEINAEMLELQDELDKLERENNELKEQLEG